MLTQDETWRGDILVTDHVVVPDGVTLTIEPGTRVTFKHYRGYREPWRRLGLDVSGGTLTAIGTPEAQIWFTSDADDPTNGDWAGIMLRDSTDSRVEYSIVEFGIHGIAQFDSAATVSHSIVRWTNSEGLYAERSSPVFENNTLYENGYHEIALEQYNENAVITGNLFRHGRCALHLEESTALVEGNCFSDYAGEIVSAAAESTIVLKDNVFRNAGFGEDGVTSDAGAVISMEGNEFGGEGIALPEFGYQDAGGYDLGYIPGDPEDRYPYVFNEEDETRRVVKRIGEGLGFGWSLTYSDGFLWLFSFSTQIGDYPDFVRLDPETGETTRFRNDTIINPRGLVSDGDYFWANDFSSLRIFKFTVSGASIEVLDSFEIPEREKGGTNGLARDGEHLLYHSRDGLRLYRLDTEGNVVEVVELAGEMPGTFVWTGEYFWTNWDVGLAKLAADGTPAGEIYAAAEGTWAMAWDGAYLWTFQRTCELWDDPKVYQIEVLDDSLM